MSALINTENENVKNESSEDEGEGWQTVTRSGRVSKPPSWNSNYESKNATMALSKAEEN